MSTASESLYYVYGHCTYRNILLYTMQNTRKILNCSLGSPKMHCIPLVMYTYVVFGGGSGFMGRGGSSFFFWKMTREWWAAALATSFISWRYSSQTWSTFLAISCSWSCGVRRYGRLTTCDSISTTSSNFPWVRGERAETLLKRTLHVVRRLPLEWTVNSSPDWTLMNLLQLSLGGGGVQLNL